MSFVIHESAIFRQFLRSKTFVLTRELLLNRLDPHTISKKERRKRTDGPMGISSVFPNNACVFMTLGTPIARSFEQYFFPFLCWRSAGKFCVDAPELGGLIISEWERNRARSTRAGINQNSFFQVFFFFSFPYRAARGEGQLGQSAPGSAY